MRTVWLLGAGFSRALGGPLLPDLLSPGSREELKVRFPDHGFGSKPVQSLHRLYGIGHKDRERGAVVPLDESIARDRDPIWSDAEEFLSYLDVAAQAEGPVRTRVEGLIAALVRTWGDHHLNATIAASLGRKIVAAECSAFLHPPPAGEIWDAYLAWGARLQPDDTVITFNYDRVPELLRDAQRRIHIVPPTGQQSGSQCNVLKLHGTGTSKRGRSQTIPSSR